MIVDCPHFPKAVVAGTTLSVCFECRTTNLNDFDSAAYVRALRAHPATLARRRTYVQHFTPGCCHYHMGIRSDGGQDD